MIPTVVAVPSRFYPEKVRAVYDMVEGDLGPGDRFIVLDNGLPFSDRHVLPPDSRVVTTLCLLDLPIYRMWSVGWEIALKVSDGPVNLAILNDDVTVLPGTIRAMAEALRSDERWWLVSADYSRSTAEGIALDGVREVHGTYRNGGVAGWCWMVRAEKHRDGLLAAWEWEDYEIWAGDDELVAQIEQLGGHVGIVSGLPVDHEGEASVSRRPELADAKGRDLAKFRAKWGMGA